MDIEKFKIAKEIQSEVEKYETQLRHIKKLLESKNLEAKIIGENDSRFGRTNVEYISSKYSESFIRNILENDIQYIEEEIESLKNKFKDL